MKAACIFGEITITGELGGWNVSVRREPSKPGLELIHIWLESSVPAVPPGLKLSWKVPQLGMQFRWHPKCRFNRALPADWGEAVTSNLASSAPVMQLGGIDGNNKMLFAVSEAKRPVRIKAGVCEESCEIVCSVELFTVPEAPISSYETILRLDARTIFYADAIRDAFDWYTRFPDYIPAPVPEAAYEAIYSSWYSYHQDVFAKPLEAECELAGEFGMKGIIVDDGWQTDDNNRGYAFCGDWEISKNRFPDMHAHVEAVHLLGMKYVVWFSVPFVGDRSANRQRFEGKYLYRIPRLDTSVLDPRFPEVREFLIAIYEKSLREWDIDGFKLDFIDSFCFDGEDPAVKENYAGRDIKSLPEAVDRLLSETMERLERIKPGILIEFRQSYIGPAIRKYGNMIRVGDCPGDILSNRVGMIDLRLSSGNTAVHSDMLEWHGTDTPETAALQLLNVLFCVPQISVKLEAVPESHRAMLKFWLGFWRKHRKALLHGTLTPLCPELCYPVVTAETAEETVTAVYGSGQCAKVPGGSGRTCWVVNAGSDAALVLELPSRPQSVERFDVTGRPVAGSIPEAGISRIAIPVSGLLKLQF